MYCQWQSPDGKHTVTIRRQALEDLRSRVMEAFLSLPGRGAEVGGILFGHTEGDQVRIEEAQESPCEHRFGPSYILSTSDREALKTVLAGKPQSREVVGAFRSYTRRPAALDDSDQQLFRTFFPDARDIFLLFEPLSALQCQVSFLSFVDGELPSNSPYPPVPLSALLAGAQPAVQEPEPARHPEVAKPAPTFHLPPAHRRREREQSEPLPPPPAPPRPRRRVLLPLLACIVLSIAAAVIYELWTMARAPRWSDLKLDARSQPGGSLQITWDAASPAAVLANRGVLIVTDGPDRRNLELSPDQVRKGALLYRPVHPDVHFRLELYGGALRASGDSLRVLAPTPISNQPATAAPPAHPATPPSQVAVTPPPQIAAAAPPKPVRAARAPVPTPERDHADRIVPATAPEPVHQVQPDVPVGIRSRIETRMVVPIQVRVGRDGRVIQALSPGDGPGLYRFLAEASLRAARQWRFTPARSAHGQPVEGRKTIEFVFTPPGTP